MSRLQHLRLVLVCRGSCSISSIHAWGGKEAAHKPGLRLCAPEWMHSGDHAPCVAVHVRAGGGVAWRQRSPQQRRGQTHICLQESVHTPNSAACDIMCVQAGEGRQGGSAGLIGNAGPNHRLCAQDWDRLRIMQHRKACLCEQVRGGKEAAQDLPGAPGPVTDFVRKVD